MECQRFNWDVLSMVLSNCPRQTQLRLMETCTTMNHEGAKLVLKDNVVIESDEQLAPFLLFMQSSGKLRQRAYYLRSLHLTNTPSTRLPPPPVLASLHIKVLQFASECLDCILRYFRQGSACTLIFLTLSDSSHALPYGELCVL